ncbi:unnamed protein product [Auanema sp. JU1783]|nr:unnamed protein product [Auanema sp. JU1783]
MSWRENNYNNQFNPHGGRNAFRGANANDDDTSNVERAASFRAMRSFTQSIECDDMPAAPELPAELDIDQIEGLKDQTEGLKNSDTNDTIIEVLKPHPNDVDPQMGETQKYKMTVPGPGHSEQEQELHKSLIRSEEDDPELEVEINLKNESRAVPPSAFNRCLGMDPSKEQDNNIRREYNNVAVQRPRPTTPTSQCTIESFAFVGSQDKVDVKPDEKIKVSIPNSRRRRSEMSCSDFYDGMSQQIPAQAKGTGRITPINNYEGDILEEDPAYKSKAPPHPVVHRRASMDWENFEEQKDISFQSTPDDEDQPTFSEEMQEERKKLRKVRQNTETKGDQSQPNDQTSPESSFPAAVCDEDNHIHENGTAKTVEDDSLKGTQDLSTNVAELAIEENVNPKEEISNEVPPSENVPEPEQHAEDVNSSTAHEETYDPNAYPGYIWNYETQQWDVDPNYVPAEGYDGQADQQYYQDNNQYSEYYAGYDQGNYDQAASTQYDYTTAAYHVGYDQATDSYGNTYNANAAQDYDYSNYNQTDQSQTPYDASAYNNGTYDQTAQQQQGYDQSAYNSNAQQYDASAYDSNAQGYDTAAYNASGQGYDQSAYNSGSQGYDQTAYNGYDSNYQNSYDQTATGNYADYDQSGYDQTNYDNTNYNQSTYEQSSYGTDYPPSVTADSGANVSEVPKTDYDGYSNQSPYADNTYNYPTQQTTDYYQDTTTSQLPPERPQPPPFSVPDFVAPSWNEKPMQESVTETSVEKKEPARPPPPSRPAPPSSAGKGDETTKEDGASHAPPPRPPPAAKGPPPRPQAPHPANIPEKEEDAWTAFKKMTEKVNIVVKNTEEQLKTLSETTAANDIKDESYLAEVGGEQGYVHNATQREIQKRLEEQKNAKTLKKKLKQQGKKVASPTFDPDEEDNMDRAAQELAAKLAAKMNLQLSSGPSIAPAAPAKSSSAKGQEEEEKAETPVSDNKESDKESPVESSDTDAKEPAVVNDDNGNDTAPVNVGWDDFGADLPPSESGFFSNKEIIEKKPDIEIDPFAPPDRSLIDETYDPFAVDAVEDIVAAAKAKAAEVQQQCTEKDDVDFYALGRQSRLSSPTPEGGSPVSHRPEGFEDNFKCNVGDDGTPTPLYDEDDSQPLEDFLPKSDNDGWELMVRHPIKKKSFMAERCWKPCFVKLEGNVLILFNNRSDTKPLQELHLQATYSLSDTTLQAYDIYGKIHTVKLQQVQYKEKVGIRPGQISRLVDGHVTKYGLPLEHSAQCNVLLKFGSLHAHELRSFVYAIEDVLFRCQAKRESKPNYKQDEVQVHCYDEYSAYVDKDGIVSDQKARVRLFCLAFVTGSPFLEIGLNDRRRQGKEIVRRKDILPMYTERWIRFENLEFHNTVNQSSFDSEQVIRLSPPDGCFFEIMRFRVRPPKNREKFLNIKSIMKIAGSKVEIRIELMASAQVERSKGGKSTKRQIPCEDVAIRFPIPEAWIYIFREERHWGVGSVHSKKLKPGKVQNLKDRLLGAVQSNDHNLIEVAIGEAKYEHVYRSLVWRIPRLPEKHHAAYKSHLLKCRFELSSFDLMPETFLPRCDVDFTMPLATVSNTVVRSVSVEQHEDSDRVEKFVRYVAKCQYKVEIDYVQCADLEVDTMDPSTNPDEVMNVVPELHQPTFEPNTVAEMHDGYRIELPERPENEPNDSSSDDEDDKKHKMPIIQIDMKNYGY